jgi:hypothetical protein
MKCVFYVSGGDPSLPVWIGDFDPLPSVGSPVEYDGEPYVVIGVREFSAVGTTPVAAIVTVSKGKGGC